MTEWHMNNFNEDHLHLWVPQFAENAPEEDQIWLTFCYAIGQQCGFGNQYWFHLQDWNIINGAYNTTIDTRVHGFNQKWGKWIKMGYLNSDEGFIMFTNPREDYHPDGWNEIQWDFVETFIKKPRVQRMWVQLYNALFTQKKFRQDLFCEKIKYNAGEIEPQGWFHSNERFWKTKGLQVPQTFYYDATRPSYLKHTYKVRGVQYPGGPTHSVVHTNNSNLNFKNGPK